MTVSQLNGHTKGLIAGTIDDTIPVALPVKVVEAVVLVYSASHSLG